VCAHSQLCVPHVRILLLFFPLRDIQALVIHPLPAHAQFFSCKSAYV
jgi:hypothetical protein